MKKNQVRRNTISEIENSGIVFYQDPLSGVPGEAIILEMGKEGMMLSQETDVIFIKATAIKDFCELMLKMSKEKKS